VKYFPVKHVSPTAKFPLSIDVISYIPMKSSEIYKEIIENSFQEN
jgi:hypothetical protein